MNNFTLRYAIYRRFRVNIGEKAQIVKERRDHGYLQATSNCNSDFRLDFNDGTYLEGGKSSLCERGVIGSSKSQRRTYSCIAPRLACRQPFEILREEITRRVRNSQNSKLSDNVGLAYRRHETRILYSLCG